MVRVSRSVFSMWKQSGERMSSKIDPAHGRLEQSTEPDHVLRVFRPDLEVEDVDVRERLERIPLPSITGLAASGPILPRPSTAVPLLTTATRFPFAV